MGNKRIRGIISKIAKVFLEKIEQLQSRKPDMDLELRLFVHNHKIKSGDLHSLGWHRDYCWSEVKGFEYFIDYLMLLPLTDKKTQTRGWTGGDLCLIFDNSRRSEFKHQPRKQMIKLRYSTNQAVVVDNMKVIHTSTDIEGMRSSNRTLLILQAVFNKS